MCLNVRRGSVRKVAKRDITVIKVLRTGSMLPTWGITYKCIDPRKTGVGTSPYQRSEYIRGKRKTSRLKPEKIFWRSGGEWFIINVGLHSYGVKENLRKVAGCKIKMVIPKGAHYYIGTFNGKKSYASNALIWRE